MRAKTTSQQRTPSMLNKGKNDLEENLNIHSMTQAEQEQLKRFAREGHNQPISIAMRRSEILQQRHMTGLSK